MITKPVPALLCTPTGHNPTSRNTPELATALSSNTAETAGAAWEDCISRVFSFSVDTEPRKSHHPRPEGIRVFMSRPWTGN